MWDASFFCGSCAVIKRTALDEIGGIAVETDARGLATRVAALRLGPNLEESWPQFWD